VRGVRLDLRNEAFEPGSSALKQRWLTGIDQLIHILNAEQSVLRLSYIDHTASTKFAEERLRQV